LYKISRLYARLENLQENYKEFDVSAADRYKDGWLLGTDNGEFGGTIYYLPDSLSTNLPINLLHTNCVLNIINRYDTIYIISGNDAWCANEGEISQLIENDDGSFRLLQVAALPEMPRRSFLLENGNILIENKHGGLFYTDDEGNFVERQLEYFLFKPDHTLEYLEK
jgi:hypothetical protein